MKNVNVSIHRHATRYDIELQIALKTLGRYRYLSLFEEELGIIVLISQIGIWLRLAGKLFISVEINKYLEIHKS